MGTPSPWRLSMEESLADGEWHPLEDVIREALKTVPPGKAFRHAERQRVWHSPHNKARVRGDESDAITVGKRGIVVHMMQTAKRDGRAEIKVVDGVKWVRDPQAGIVREKPKKPEVMPSAVPKLLDELVEQRMFWQQAYKLIGKNVDVRIALLGDDPLARIEKILAEYGR